VIDGDGTNEGLVPIGTVFQRVHDDGRWFPGGQWIAYTGPGGQVHKVSTVTNEEILVLPDAAAPFPAGQGAFVHDVSADGQYIAFEYARTGSQQIGIVHADGSGAVFFNAPGGDYSYTPSLSRCQ
jgi:hypothetical protein